MNVTTMISTGTGTGPICPAPSQAYVPVIPPIGRPFETVSAAPLADRHHGQGDDEGRHAAPNDDAAIDGANRRT